MGWLTKRKRGTQLDRQVALGLLEDGMARAVPIPAGAPIATRTGTVAHRKSALHPGARCEAMSEWTDWRVVDVIDGFRVCRRCEMAGEAREAS